MVLLTCVNKTPHFLLVSGAKSRKSAGCYVMAVVLGGGGDHKTLSDLTSQRIFPVSGVSYVAL